jgi:hypothetical protein
LAGDPPPPTSEPSLRELADLRGGLGEDVDGARSRAILLALAQKVTVEAFVLVSYSPPSAPVARLARVDEGEHGTLIVRIDPATFTGVPPTTTDGDYEWPHVDDAVSGLLGPELPKPILPKKSDTSKLPPPAPKKDDSKPITQKPWFWGIVGGVAALGVTAVILSQTVNTSSGSVHIQGKVLP